MVRRAESVILPVGPRSSWHIARSFTRAALEVRPLFRRTWTCSVNPLRRSAPERQGATGITAVSFTMPLWQESGRRTQAPCRIRRAADAAPPNAPPQVGELLGHLGERHAHRVRPLQQERDTGMGGHHRRSARCRTGPVAAAPPGLPARILPACATCPAAAQDAMHVLIGRLPHAAG